MTDGFGERSNCVEGILPPCRRPSMPDISGDTFYPTLPVGDKPGNKSQGHEARGSGSQRCGPRLVTPNSGRRRHPIPNLVRNVATPSHHVKMASMFQEAAVEIQSAQKAISHSRCLLGAFDMPQIRRPTFPHSFRPAIQSASETLLQVQKRRSRSRDKSPRPSVTRALTPPDLQYERIFPTLPSPLEIPSPHTPVKSAALEPLSSGFTYPAGPESQVSDERAANSLSIYEDSDGDDCHSSHGVPYVIIPREPRPSPPRQNLNIDAWLDELADPASDPASAIRMGSKACIMSSPGQTDDVRSSPTPHVISTKLRESTTSTVPCRSTCIFAPTDQKPQLHAALPRRPIYTTLSKDAPLLKSPPRHPSNKENHPPPTFALSWSSTASSSPGELNADAGLHTRTSPDLPSLSRHNRPKTISHPSFSTPTTLCSSTRRKKLKFSSPSSKPLPVVETCQRFGSSQSTTNANEVVHTGGSLSAGRTVCTTDQGETGKHRVVEKNVPLSPEVERFRKGKGPRRERCASYWDGDIVPGFSPSNGVAHIKEVDTADNTT